jgi:hypothetical protein
MNGGGVSDGDGAVVESVEGAKALVETGFWISRVGLGWFSGGAWMDMDDLLL